MFQTFFIQPIYNGFIYLISVIPGGDVGFAIIALTILIRLIMYPVFTASIRSTMGMQAVQGELDEINKKYKDNPDEKAKKTMQLFKDNKVSPFSGILAILVQIPVFIALYYAFFREGLPKIATELLYPFVHAPQIINVNFLGFVDLLAPHNIILALLVGGLQYLVTRFTLIRTKNATKTPVASDKQAAQRMQQQMMLYFLPALMAVISYSLPAAVGIYFATTNLVSLGQEWLIQRQIQKQK